MRLHKILAVPPRAQFGFTNGGMMAHGYRLYAALAVVGAAALFTTAAQGTDYGLNGGTSGTPLDWNNSASWGQLGNINNHNVPGAGDNAWIGIYWNNGGQFPLSSYGTLSAAGTTQVNDLNLARNFQDGNQQAQGTLNVTGATTVLSVLGTFNMNDQGNANGNASGTLNIDAATINASNDSNIGTGGGLNSANVNISNGGQLNFANNLNIGTDRGVRGTNITLSETSQLNVVNSLNLNGTFNIGPSAQVNVGNDLNLRGGNWYDEGLGANSVAAYNLPLTSTPTAGMVSFGRSLTIGNGYNQNVSLTVDSGATTASYSGGLYIASGDYANHGTLNLVGGAAANRTMNFAGDLQMSYGNARGDTNNGSLATLNLNNDGSNNFGAILNIAGNLWAGYTNSNRDQQNSAAAISVSSKSQLNITGGLFLNGSGGWNGTSANGSNWDPANYTLNLANTPTNGMVSFQGGLNLTTNDNYGNVSLTVGSGSATTINATQFNMAQSYASQGAFTMGGNHILHVASDSNMATGGSDYGSGYSNNATLNLSNTAQLNFDGNLTMGVDRTSHLNQVNVNLANSSQLNVGNSLTFNGTFNIGPSAQVNVGNDLNLRGGNWYDEGLGANSVAAYNLPLTSTPTAGMVSFGRSLTIGNGYNQNVSLTVDSGATTASYSGGLYIASGDYANHGTLNLVGGAAANRTMNFAGDLQMSYGNARGDTNNGSLATLNLNNDGSNNFGAILNIAGNLWAGYTNSNRDQQNSAAAISVSSKSQLNITGGLFLNGSGGWNGTSANGSNWDPANYTLNLANTPTNGMVSFQGGLNLTTNDNYGNVSLTVGSGSATTINATQFNMAQSYASQGAFTMGGNHILHVASDSNMATGGSDYGSGYSNNATLNLSNTAQLNFDGNLTMGVDRTSHLNQVNVNLANSSQLNVGNSLTFNGTFNIGPSAQVNVGNDLNLRGGNWYDEGLGANSVAAYNLPLTSTPTAGMVSFGRSLTIGNGYNQNVSLTVDSGATTASYSGGLYIASGDYANHGTLNLVGGAAANRTMNFAGDLQMSYGNARGDTNNGSLATLNLNNDGSNNFGAILNVAGNMLIGYSNNDQNQQNSAAEINISSQSQLNITGGLFLNGSGGWNGTSANGSNWDPANYTLNLANTPTNGMVSFQGGLNLTTNDNYGNVSLTVGSGSATTINATQFNMAQSYASQGAFTMGGNHILHMASDSNMATGGSDYGSGYSNNATLNLSNTAQLNFDGNLTMGVDRTSHLNQVNVNLANSSQLNVGNSLTFNGTFNIGPSAQVNVGNDLNLRGGNWYDEGLGANSVAAYNLPLTSTPTAGMVSFGRSLTIGNGYNQNVSLTVDSGATTASYSGGLYIASGDYANHGTLNLVGGAAANRTMNFAGDLQMSYGNARGDTNNGSLATLNLNNDGSNNFGAILNVAGNMLIGYSNNDQNQQNSAAEINISSQSQLNIGGSVYFRGSGAWNGSTFGTTSYNLGLAATPTNGAMTFSGGLNIADTNFNKADVTFTGTGTVSAHGDVNVATGYRTGGSLTLDGVSISSNGSGRFATAGDSGDPTNHPNKATVTLLNGASLSFNNQTQLGNGGSSSASITGNGTFDAGSTFYNSGRVVASGGTLNVNYGNLNTPSSGWNGNVQADGTQAGWYATNGGLLAMKNATVANGATKVNWGENASLSSLSTNSLVNSAQLTAAFSGSGGSAAINGVLIAPNLVTGLTNTIGVWDFRSMGGLSFTDGTLTFRYDDALAASLGAATNALEIFQFQAGNWTLISGATASGNLISTTANIVSNFGSGSYFAIATAGGAGSVPSTTPYVGTRATTEIYATSANVDWTTDPGWYNRDRNTLVGAPQGRDNVHIGSGTGTTVALNDGQTYQAGNLYIGLSDDNNTASNYNWANGTLNVSNGSTLNVVGNVQVASWSDNTTNGTLSLDGASTMNVGGALYLANNNNSTATLNLANNSILNVAGGVILGHGTKTVSIDATSQLNLTGGTLYLDNDRYTADGANGSFKLPFASTPTGGKVSVTAATSLAIRDQWGNDASLTLDGSADGITFNNLYLGTDVNTSNVATLNVAGPTVTFNGNAELGSHYGENGGRWNNASATAINVTSGGVLNIGGNVTAGGWSNNAQTSSTIAIAGDSQLNMTGTNMRLDLKAGNYAIAFANTPTNGKFSVSPTTNIWIANAEDNFTFQSTLTMAAGSNVQFNTLTMAWDNASQNSTANLNIGSASNVTFTGTAYMGGRSAWANQGQGVVNVSVADGSVLNFGNTVYMGGQSSLDLHDSGRVNVAGDVYLGGQGSATNITLGAASQINMTGTGRALALADGDYSGYVFTNTPTDGQFSVTQSTNLYVRPQAANATVAFGPGSNIQFNNLYLGTDVNTSNTATMNLSAATVTFSGNAELGSHYGDNGGRWNNAANTAINVANGSVLNFGANVTAGGWSNNAQTTSTVTIESDSQINMTGNNMRLDLKAGNYSLGFANTPTNGMFSVKPTTNLWIANAEDNFTLQSTLNIAAGTTAQFNTLTMAWDNASQNSTANLNFGIASNVTFTGAANMGGRSAWANQGQGIARVSVADGSVVNFGGAVFMGGQSSLNLNSSGQVNAANDVYFGGQGYATTVTLGVASQLNMTGSGRTLAFADGDYSSLKISNTPAPSKISVTSSTNLYVRPQGADATVAFGAASNGLQLSNLYMGTDVNSSNTAKLNVAGATVTFSGSAELGSHYGDNGGRWNNAANTAINVTNGGVLNIGGNLTAGGWSNNAQTSAALNVDATSQINLTGKNNRIDIKGGTTTAQFTNTPTNGAVSLQAQSHTNAGTDLWLSNALDNFPLNARLNFAAGTNVQFHNLRMAWDNASAGSQPTMGLQGGAQVTFTGDSYIGGNTGNQGSAVITGNGTLTFNQTLNMGRTHVEANGGTLTLNFPSYNRTETSNVMNNPVGTGLGANSYAGWYASNGGKLVLPNLTVTNSTSQLDWGDVSNNALDINRNVNSIRLTNLNVTGGGTNNLGISLLDMNNAETFSGLHGAIGIWKFDPTGGLNITSALMAFRYDTAAMAALQLPDSSFNLYENFGTGWKLLQSSPQDQANHLISGTGTLINANGPYPYVQFAIAQTVAASGGVVWNGASSGPGDNNWTTAANWVGNAAPTPGSNNDQDLVHFAGNQRTNAVNDFAAGSSFSGILFGQDATASFSLTGNAIVLNGDVTNSSNLSHNIGLNMALAHATTVVDSGSNNNQVVTLSGNLSDNGGPAGITKLGNGSTLVLSGNNTNTGAILISEGTVSVGSIGVGGAASNLGAASNAASNLVMDGGRLQYTGAGDTTDRNFTINNGKVATFDVTNAAAKLVLGAAANVSTGTLTKTGAGTLALTGQSQYTGATTVTGGALSVGDGGSGNSLATSGITFSNGAKLILNQSDSSTFSTPFSGAAGLIKDGTGTVTLPGVASSYTGATEIKNGTLRLVPASPVSNGLQAWFAANKNVTTSGTQVTTWGDISGNGHDAVLGANTSTLAAGQINGLPAVQFRNSWLDINTNMTVGSEYIVVKSGAYTYDPGNPNHFGPDWSAAIGRQDGGGWLFRPGDTNFWEGNQPLAVSQNGTALNQGDLYRMTNVGDYMVLKVDTNNVANTLYTLGRNGGWTNGYLDVAEVLAFDHVLTAGDEAKVGGYLATKYGIGTAYAPYSLPDALPANTPVSISTGATLDMNGATATIGLTGQTGSSILLGGGTLNVNSTVDSPFAGNISGGGSFNKLGSATLTLSGVNTQTATTTISQGTLKIGSTTGLSQTTGATVVAAGGTLDLGGFNATTNGLVTFAGGPVQNGAIINNGDGYAGQSGTVSASLQGTGGLTKTTAGTLNLTASNTFTGDTTLSAGTLTLGHALALQNSTLKPAGGTLGFGGGVTSPTLGGLAGSGNLAIATPVTLNVGNNNQDTTYSGVISGSASLNKIGSGVLTLSGTNTYAGSTTISSGTLRLQGSPVMPSGVNAWFSASSLNYANGQNITTWADLTGGHVATLNQGNMTFLTNQVNGQPAVQFSGNAYANMTGDMFSKQQYFVFSMPNPGGDWGTIIGSQSRSGYMFNPNGFMWDGNYPQAVIQNGGAPLNPNFQLSNIGNFMVVQVTGNSNDTSIRSGWALDRQEGWGGMNMNLAEVISFDHALSNSEQGAVGAYLSSKYGISTGYSGLLATSGVLPTSTVVTMASNTTFDVNNANQQIAQLRDAIPGTTTGHQVTLGQGTLTVGDAGNFSFSGTISGTGGITKVGSGVMDLKGANDFTGTATAGGGVLLISSSLTGGANVAAAYDNTTATLGGTGTINGLATVSSPTGLGRTNRITGAGVGTTGTLNLAGGLSFAAGAGGYFDINSTSDGDYLNVSGGSFTAAVGSVIAVPDSINRGTYNLIGFTGSAPSLSNFVLQDLNGNGASGGFLLSYTGNVLQLIVNSDSLVWNGGSTGPGNNNWTSGDNWTGGLAPQAGDRLAFAGSTRTSPNNDFVPPGTAFSGISFNANAAAFTLGGNSIALQGNINNNSSNDQVINLDLALQSQAGIGTGATGKNLTLNGTLSGAGGLNVTGSGSLILTAANTYAGDTKLTNGTLKLSNQNAVQNSTLILNGGNLVFDSAVGGNFTLGGLTAYTPGPGFDITLQDSASNAVALTVGGNNASTLYAGVLNGSGSLIKNGTGTLTLSAASTHTGGTTINDGTVILTAANTSSGATTVSGGTLRLSNQNAVQNSVLTMNGGAVVFDSAVGGTFNFAGLAAATSGAGYDITLQDSANNPLTMVIDGRNTNFAGGLSGSGSLIKSGTGTQELSGILSYTGTTTINSGVLKVTGTGSNTASNAVNVNGGELDLGKTSGLAFSFTSINIGRTDGSSATSATLKLLGSNQLSSNTDLFIFNQGVLDLHGQNLTINTLNDSGASNTGRVDNTAGNGTLTVVGGEFYGVIQNSPGTTLNLTVASPTLVLYNANNTYSGTTTINPGAALLLSNSSVNNNIAGSQVIDVQNAVTQFGTSIGRLIVNSPAPENNGFGSLKNNKLTLSSGQTIAGTGRIVGNLEIASGSTLSPGALTGSPGTLSQQQGSQTWDGGGHYKWELNQVDTSSVSQAALRGISPGYDWMNVTGGLIVAATSGNKFNVDITGVSGGVAGAAANWDPHNSFSWTLATASTGITGSISTANFALNTAGFFSNNGQNNQGAAAFSISRPPLSNDVVLSFQGGAATAYWGLAGATPSGTWSSSDASWSLLANGNGAAYKWTNGDDAVFSASVNATGAFNVTINGGVSVHSITVEEGSPTIQSGTLTLIGATPTITVNASRSLVINTQVFGSNGLTKAGAGDLVLGGANTYSGGTTINQGKLKLGANNVIPNGPGAGNLAFSPGSGNSAILDLAGFNETVNGLSNGGLGTSLIDNTAAGSISTLTVGDGDADGPSLSFGGVIQNTGAGAMLNLTKVGIGTLGLSGANTYSGATAIKQGTVALSAGNNRLPTGTTVILGEGNNSGTLKLTSGGTPRNQTLAGLTTSGTGANNRVVGGASSNSVLTLNIADSDTFDGSLGGPNFFDNNLSLTKTGNGQLTLRGNNNYGGPTLVNAGELVVDGTNSETGAVTVAAGATLSGHGKLNSVIQGAGLISPGNSPGILSFAQINPLGGMDFGFELTQAGDPLWSNAAASLNDVLRITDAATPFTADLTSAHGNVVDIFFNAGSLTAGEVFRGGFYTDLDNDFINSVSSATFRFWVEGAGGTKNFNGNDYFSLSSVYPTLTVDVSTSQVALANFEPAGPSGDVTNGWVTQFSVNLNDEPVAAPEPSTLVLSALGLAALGFVAWRRRRRV